VHEHEQFTLCLLKSALVTLTHRPSVCDADQFEAATVECPLALARTSCKDCVTMTTDNYGQHGVCSAGAANARGACWQPRHRGTFCRLQQRQQAAQAFRSELRHAAGERQHRELDLR